MSSQRDKSYSQSESSSTTNQSTPNDITDESSKGPSPKLSSTPRNHNKKNLSLVQILDEIPPPPYHTQVPTPSHPRDHITITLTSPPEYTITTQPCATPLPIHHHNNSCSRDALLTPTQELKFCKICQEQEDSLDEDDGKLISPCKCKGSLQYVHIGCLNKWRHSNVRAEASYRCEVCKYEYKFYRPRVAKILSNGITLHFFTLMLLLSTVYLLSYMVKTYFDKRSNEDDSKDPDYPRNPRERSWKDIEIPYLNLHMIHLVIGTSIFSIFGIIFFTAMICFNGFRRTSRDYCYCGGCSNTCYGGGYGSCYAGDCGSGSGGGDCGGVIIVFAIVILVAIFLFGLIAGVIAAYLFTQRITTFFLEKVHDRILEVKKDLE